MLEKQINEFIDYCRDLPYKHRKRHNIDRKVLIILYSLFFLLIHIGP